MASLAFAWPTLYILDAEGKIRFKNVRGKSLGRPLKNY